jgi:signal transduction histidine kinase
VLCSLATGPNARSSDELNALVRRQLPLVAQRLEQTLARFQRPRAEEETVAAAAWWDALARQYQNQGVTFMPVHGDARLPRALFDSVADNLIRNALAKGAGVRLSLENQTLRVCDDGAAVPTEMVESLLKRPIASTGGLGIGLYQAARQAEASGYRLELESNRDGEVCFALAGPAKAP